MRRRSERNVRRADVPVGIAMYPVLKNKSSALALGSVAFRTMEALMHGVAGAILLSVLAAGRRYAQAGPADRAQVLASADALLDLRQQVVLVAVLAFSAGALMYCGVFYRWRLVPRSLSAAGLSTSDWVDEPGTSACCAPSG
jgi:hypothetical protein